MANSHKRDTDARPKPSAVKIAGTVAVFATGAAVVAGVALKTPDNQNLVAEDTAAKQSASATPTMRATAEPRREARSVSRSFSRSSVAAAESLVTGDTRARTVRETATKMWTTTDLNLWTLAGIGSRMLDVVPEGSPVSWTGRTVAGRDEIVVDGVVRWVTHGYLSKDKPEPETAGASAGASAGGSAGLSMAPCADSSVENGLTDEAVHVYRSVCHAFPMITTYLGWDDHGEHSSGKAIDIMTSDKALGDQIAAFLQAHASELDLYDVIWWDRIWTPVRASEGWRAYGDHGSATANHMDHVHVSTNG